MKKYQIIIGCLFNVILLAGCNNERDNAKIHPSFFSEPHSVMITHVSGLEEPGYYQIGSQGLLDYAINSAISNSMYQKIKEIDASSILEEYYYDRYASAFSERSFTVTKANKAIDKKLLAPPLKKDSQHAPYDFKSLQDKHGTEYALILEPKIFGVQRSYYSFVPISKPSGVAQINMYLVNLSDNSIVGEYQTKAQDVTVGDWDTPPHYTTLVNASKNALAKALSEGYIFFFQE